MSDREPDERQDSRQLEDDGGEAEFLFAGEQPPRVPPGRYAVGFEYSETRKSQWGPKVMLHFRILDGECRGIRLFRSYAVQRLLSDPRRGGKFEPKGPTSAMYRELFAVLGESPLNRRMSLSRLRQMIIIAEVDDVKCDGRGKELPLGARYSVITCLLGAEPADS